tara:strand:- start:1982 stop:2443 length:462 start_codon:yes stop_codon:yes gene_type:complete
MIFINTSIQKIFLFKSNDIIFESDISTSEYGLGSILDSNKTPTGLHIVASMLGGKLPQGTLFKNRIPTSTIINNVPQDNHDYITSRIIRLSGLEDGFNKGGNVDTFDRYIYIHGTPHVDKLGTAKSHGCIRMSDKDVIKLFNLICIRELVLID